MKKEKESIWAILSHLSKFLLVVLVFAVPVTQAADLDTTITNEDKQKFDQILTPIGKIYNFIKYAASLIAVIALLFAGISYMFSGNDVRKRDISKNMAAYVVIGLSVIWAARFVVNLLVA